MKKISLIFALFLLLPIGVLAQNLRGRVTHGANGVPGVHVINRSAGKATITNDDGYFALSTKEGDTLYFSSLHLERKTVIVDQELQLLGFLSLSLKEAVQQLDEVILRPFNLSGDLDKDMEGYMQGEVATAATLGLPNAYARTYTQSERMLYEATSGSGLIPLNPILNGISGRTKYLKKRVKRDNTYSRTRALRRQLGDSLIVKALGIPVEKIADFMYYCEVDPTFQESMKKGDLLNLLEYMKSKSSSYRKDNTR